MVLMLTMFFPYNLALQGDATRHPRFDQWVSWTWDSLERVKQFLKFMDKSLLKGLYIKWQISRAILSGNFRMLDSFEQVWHMIRATKKMHKLHGFLFQNKDIFNRIWILWPNQKKKNVNEVQILPYLLLLEFSC